MTDRGNALSCISYSVRSSKGLILSPFYRIKERVCIGLQSDLVWEESYLDSGRPEGSTGCERISLNEAIF